MTKVFAMFLCGWACFAQSADAPKEPMKFYKLDFVLKDVEGTKVLSARNYSVVVSAQSASRIRAGSKVPIRSGTTYQDIGTNVDCKDLLEAGNEISFDLKVEASSLLQDNDQTPVIRQNSWESHVIIPLKKPTIVFSSDDNTTKRALQFEVTATPRP